MKKQCVIIGALAFLSAFNTINAQEKIEEKKEKREALDEIVIDSRFRIKKENSGKIVQKITPKVIEQNKGKTIVDLINRISGIEINGNNSVAGQTLGYFVRGGRSNEVVILIDGVQVVNPLQNNFDLRYIDLEQVSSIEISKGASSTLYGSGAATAVIDIRMKKAKNNGFNGSAGVLVGTNQTQDSENVGSVIQTNVGANGRVDDFDYSVTFSSFQSDGISAARDNTSNQTFGDDPFRRNNFDLRLGQQFSEKFKASAFFSVSNFNNSFDAGALADGNNRTKETNYRMGIMPQYAYDKGTIHLNFAYSKFDIDRVLTSFPGKSDGDNYMIDAFVKHNFGKLKLIGGVNFQSNKIRTFSIPFGATELTETQFAQDPKTTITDPYANIVYISETGFNVNAGVRMNNHNIYGSHLVYNVNPSYRFTNENGYTRVFGSYSTAFIAPSIQELFSSFGNPGLDPQESATYEFGAEFKRKSFSINAVYFNRDVENLIVFDSSLFILVNSGDTTINGVEVNASYDVTDNLSINGNYTHTKNDAIAIRIPKGKANLGVSYTWKENTNFSLDYQYVSDRDDTDFRDFLAPQSLTLDSYSLLDFSVNHQLRKGVKLFGSVTNITNEDFQEIFGFSTRGRNFKLGLQFQF